MPTKITKNMLPNLPDEIFEMFIVPQNEASLNVFDSQPGGRWFYHLGNLSIEQFSQLRWRKSELFFNKDIFHPLSVGDINGLIEHCTPGNTFHERAFGNWYPKDSGTRLAWHKDFIINAGKLCAPIVCIKTNEGFRVLDGTHRLAAAFLIEKHDLIPLDSWIGEN